MYTEDRGMSEEKYNEDLWENHYHIGVEKVDEQHDKLFSIARRIAKIGEESSQNQFRRAFVGKEGIKFLKSYTLQHFADEEAYMKRIGYPHFAAHKQEHDKFRDVIVPGLEQNLIQTGYAQESVEALVAAVLAWLVNHIAKTDFAIIGKAVPFEYDAETEQIEETIANVTIHMLTGLFDLKISVLQTHYGGEDFGESIYYERSYRSPQTSQKIQFITVISNEMSAYLCGMLLGDPSLATQNMAASLIEEFSFMLIQHLDSILIKEEHQCDYADGNFFDRQTFEQKMHAKMPEFSILFETNAGKFAVCLDRMPIL